MILSVDSGNSAEKNTCFDSCECLPIEWMIRYAEESDDPTVAAVVKSMVEHHYMEKYDSNLAKRLQAMQAKCRPKTQIDKLEINRLDKQELNVNERVGQFVAYAGSINDFNSETNEKITDNTKNYDTRRNDGVAAGGECQQTTGYPNFEFSWPNWSANCSRG